MRGIKITGEESLELQQAIEPLILKYGETEVKNEIEYIINWCIGNEDAFEKFIDEQLEVERRK